MSNSKNMNKERSHYSNQNCTNYNNYTRNANFKSEPFEGEELDDLSKLGSEYANELAFNSYYGKNSQSKASQNSSSINNKQSNARMKSQNNTKNNQNK